MGKIILSIFIGCLCISLKAQPPHVFTQYTATDGFNQHIVSDILQDDKGFMWFATWDGISRFDGHTFRNYKHAVDSVNTFISNRINMIQKDSWDCIWTLGHDKHVSRFDPRTERLISVSDKDAQIKRMFILPGSHSWLEAENSEVYLITTDTTGLTVHSEHISRQRNVSFGNKVYHVKMDDTGNHWIMAASGLYTYDGNTLAHSALKAEQAFTDMQETPQVLYFSSIAGQIWKYHKSTGTFNVLQLPTASEISTFQLLDGDKLFCGTTSDGFFITATDGSEMRHFTHATHKMMPDDRVKSVYRDIHGELWIQMQFKGVLHFNPQTEEINHFEIRDNQGNTVIDGRLQQMVWEDRQGNLYIHPSGGGFAFYDRKHKKLIPFYNKQLLRGWRDSYHIMDVYKDRQDNIWLSSHVNGLEKITFYNKHFTLFSPPELQSEQDNSRSVFIDRDKRTWIGLRHRGIAVYDANRRFLGYLQADGTLSESGNSLRVTAYAITQDHQGTIWIGLKKYGVIAARAGKRPGTFALTRYQYNADDVYSISNNDVTCIYEDHQHRLWFTTLNGGVNYLETDTESHARFINYRNRLTGYPSKSCLRTRHITSDQQGRLWLSTTDGVLVFNDKFTHPQHIRFIPIKKIPGNAESLNNDDIEYIYCSGRGDIYVATFGGGLNKLLSFEEGASRFRPLTKKDGLLSDIVLSIAEDKQSHLWIATLNGLSRFNQESESFENYSVKEFAEPIKFNEGEGRYSERDGALLFNTQQGLLSFRPETVYKSAYVPPIVFTQLLLGDQLIMPRDSTNILHTSINETKQLTLPHNRRSFSIRFAALDMNDPAHISYVYRLKEFETQWTHTEKTRTAHYTNIPKGDYVLEVRSTNSDGVWVENTRALSIRVLPSFWETPWAILVYILMLFVVMYVITYILFTFYKLRHKIKMEKKLSDIKLQFFTDISHELRTPLTLITAPVKSALAHKDLQPEVRYQLQLVDRNTNRMNYLINQILDFRKIQNRKMQMMVQQLDVLPFLRHLMACFQGLADKHRVDFTLDTDLQSLILWADVDKLEKTLFNLIANAFKYTPEGKQINIRVAEDDDHINISICDQGIGIPKNKQEQLFERFATITNNLSGHKTSSTGIGLSLSKELIEMHKGKIFLQSEPDKGSTFTISLRKGKSHFEDSMLIKADTPVSYMYNADSTNFFGITSEVLEPGCPVPDLLEEGCQDMKTLLLVEDNEELRGYLRTVFDVGFDIIEAPNGMQGLKLAKKRMPDLIISDIMMPQKSGIELLRELRLDSDINHIPVILLTSKSAIENQIEGIELGADDYITKPFSIDFLKARVSGILEQRRKLQQHYCRQFVSPETPVDTITSTITDNNQAFMNRLVQSVNKHLSNGNLLIEDLAQEVGMSRAIFFRKIKSLTGLSPIEFLKDVRLKRAAELIRSTDLTMSQIAYHVGFNDAHYFSKCFKLQFGITPTEYKETNETL